MLLALGVSGAANAVQMHGVVRGTLTSFSDNGADKAWGYQPPGVALPDAVRVDFWFNSDLLADYDKKPAGYIFKDSTVPTESVLLSATYNGVPHTISSDYRWSIQDYLSTGDDRYIMVNILISESPVATRKADLYLAFADNSIPVLQEAMLGHVVKTTTLEPVSSISYFFYNGIVNGKTYESKLAFKPDSFAIAPVPEPETWAMMLLGLGVVGYAARRRAAG